MDEPSEAPRLPNEVVWFAPWTWRPWKRWVLIATFVLGYVVLHVPVSYLIVCSDGHTNPAVQWSYSVAYYPLHQLGWYSPPINSCYQAQWRWMNDTFGDVEHKLKTQRN